MNRRVGVGVVAVAAGCGTGRAGLSRFAGRELQLDDEVYRSASATNLRNRALAQLLGSLGVLDADAEETLDVYTRQSCLAVTARDLAVMVRPSPTAG